jgi:DNA-binding NtrC family response regulator
MEAGFSRGTTLQKVLVADSSSIIQFALERILGRQGFDIHYVRHVRDLIAQAREVMPDIIFMEAEISRSHGRKVCEYLHNQANTRGIPIILMTRIADPTKYNMQQWPGVRALLRKPLSTDRVHIALENVTKQTEQHEADTDRRADAV